MRLGLVEVSETVRSEGYPDRIVYGITDSGREVARVWLREMLRTTGDEYPEFIAAVSIMFGLAPDDAREQLEQRERRLAAELAETKPSLPAPRPDCRGYSCSRRSTARRCSRRSSRGSAA